MNDILRSGTTRRWSDTTAFNGLLYFCEVPEDVSGDIAQQTAEVLALIEGRLRDNNSDHSRLLSLTLYLPFPADLPAFNALWDAWIPAGCAPVRACLHVALTNPAMRIEIQGVAALNRNT